jgi:hypothetical protein
MKISVLLAAFISATMASLTVEDTFLGKVPLPKRKLAMSN